MRFHFSWRVDATRNFDHRWVADLDSRTKPVIEGAAGPDRLSDQPPDRPSLPRQGCLQFARDHDRRTIAGDKLKIKAEARKSNPSHHAFDHHKSAGAATQLRRIGRLYHGEVGVAPYPKSASARAVLDCQTFRGAAPRLKLRADAGVARRQQRCGGRVGRPVAGIRDNEISDRPAPAVGSPGQQDEVSVTTEQSIAQEIARGLRDLGLASIGIGRVEPAEPNGSTVAQLDVEALIDVDRLNAPARPTASRKRGGGESDGDKPGAHAGEAPGAPDRCAAAVCEAEIHAKGMPRDG
jgi:hypothetical protein